jgi:hypothetical protein
MPTARDAGIHRQNVLDFYVQEDNSWLDLMLVIRGKSANTEVRIPRVKLCELFERELASLADVSRGLSTID